MAKPMVAENYFITKEKLIELTEKNLKLKDENQKLKEKIKTLEAYNEQMQNERYAEVTHFGLTKDKTLHLGQVLQSEAGERYVIHLPANHITPYSQLHLKRIENYG